MTTPRPLLLFSLVCGALLVSPHREARGAGSLQETPSFRLAPDLEVLELQFGELQEGQGRPRFVPSQRIRLEPNHAYGWRMRVRTSRAQLRWQEDLLLPRAPEQWGISQYVKLSSDRRRAVTTMTAEPSEGWIENFWWIAEGDPPGAYELEVSLEGKHVGEVRFDVY